MIRNICKDTNLLGQISLDLKKEEISIVNDLKDTLRINISRCVGMAANMIGELKNAIVFVDEGKNIVAMINPKIIKKEGQYETSEGCLSLLGERKTKRYKKIKVKYLDENFKERTKNFEGFVAQIIQHEVDHLNGILI